MTTIDFTVEGKPFGKQRPRFTRNGHAYTPDETRVHEAIIRDAFVATAKEQGVKDFLSPVFRGAVMVGVTARFKMPSSWSKRKRAEMNGMAHTSRPDGDNILKLCCDALNGVAYADDGQVYYKRIIKLWSDEESVKIELKGFEKNESN